MGVILTIKAGEGKKKLTKKTRELEKLSKDFLQENLRGKSSSHRNRFYCKED